MSKSLTQSQNLRDAYQQLTDSQQSIVQIFALLHVPSPRPKAHACWIASTVGNTGKAHLKLLEATLFSQAVDQLIASNLLNQRFPNTVCCPPQLMEIAIRDAVLSETFEAMAISIETASPVRKHFQSGTRDFRNPGEFMRSLRIAIYREDMAEIDALFDEISHLPWQADIEFFDVLRDLLNTPFDADWMRSLSADFLEMGLSAILDDARERCVPSTEAFELLEEIYETVTEIDIEVSLLYAEHLWLRGHLLEVSDVLDDVEISDDLDEYAHQYHALRGAIAFLNGNTDTAIAQYQLGIQAAGTTPEEQAAWFTLPATVLFFFALLKAGTVDAQRDLSRYGQLLQRQPHHWLSLSMSPLLAVVRRQQGHASEAIAALEAVERLNHINTLLTEGLPAVLESYCLHWLSIDNLAQWLPGELTQRCRTALEAGYVWIVLAIAELLGHYQPDNLYVSISQALQDQSDTLPLIETLECKAPWELSLQSLIHLTTPPEESAIATQSATFRLAWRLHFRSANTWSLTPLEQKIGKRGGWTKGKPIALKRLADEDEIPDYATDHDRRICATILIDYEQDTYYYYRSPKATYYFAGDTLLALAGHPLVFWEDAPNVRVDVVTGETELIVKRLEGERLSLELIPPVGNAEILASKETPTRLKVIAVTPEHHRIAKILGPRNKLEVPTAAEETVLQAIASVASLVTVQSDIGGGVEAEEVPSDATPRVHLLPAGSGLKVSLLTHPFPEGGAYYRPGEGGETVIAEVEGQRLQTRRDLTAEKENAQAVNAACTVLQQSEPENGEWLIEEPSECLELLLQLQMLGEQVTLEWPEGETFKVSRQLGINDFKFELRQQQDWFAASGEVQISEDRVMDLRQLMALLEGAPGQFVPLANGEFLALTDEFRQRLKTLGRLSTPQGKDLRIHGLAALALDDMLDDVEQLKVDQDWKNHITHIKAACKIEPQVPKTLKATLRDYQLAGYTWLARLAHWGVGACLADDMGLGKTLQGLAVILDRCDQGPALVIAPTSVCMNWASEAERFAPSVQVKSLGECDRTDRQALLDGLAPHDLLVCSYGLLQQEDVAAMLTGITWQTIVLDEAQAIKNHATKRSQAVMALQSSFKVIMTGTPIENHLGELWNLFRFINPGLLGSLDSFNQRFANPIERDKDEAASDTLRRLIQPFILRRTKDQVLKELPSRTEITLPVELSTEEMAFYEALRREALEKLSDSDAQAGQKHLQVLAEIMKLRRACCNPSLVKPELAIGSTKLEQFSELIAELLENGHKALVFSQFVDHLKILRQHLEDQQIAYQYLDGSTPAKKRKQSVEAFQNGKGDVFLISLKAGGTGLNLTAADYVLHMDPWWNPAVEDQASDRAHRIGQQRPVTIYRLVAKGTIEDKIVALHKLKRDLADSLLTGSDVSSKVSTEQLLSLMQQ